MAPDAAPMAAATAPAAPPDTYILAQSSITKMLNAIKKMHARTHDYTRTYGRLLQASNIYTQTWSKHIHTDMDAVGPRQRNIPPGVGFFAPSAATHEPIVWCTRRRGDESVSKRAGEEREDGGRESERRRTRARKGE
jgi:hypothetical protein